MPILPSAFSAKSYPRHSPPNLLETPLRQNSTDLTISFHRAWLGHPWRAHFCCARQGDRSWQRGKSLRELELSECATLETWFNSQSKLMDSCYSPQQTSSPFDF